MFNKKIIIKDSAVNINNIGWLRTGIKILCQISISILDWINELSNNYCSPISEFTWKIFHDFPNVIGLIRKFRINKVIKFIKNNNLIFLMFSIVILNN